MEACGGHGATWLPLPSASNWRRLAWRHRVLFSLLLPPSLRRAATVLTLSAQARDEIQRFDPGLRAPVRVGPAAPKQIFRPLDADTAAAVLARHDLRRPFLLAVGSLQPRKNLTRLVEAFDQVRRRHPDIHLVIVGPSGFRASALRDAMANAGLADAVRLLGYVSEDELMALYNAAVALVYPSVYEGFGLPVVEAMACGRPVIAANASSLPEVAGTAALLVDPFDVSAQGSAMERLLADPQAAADLGTRGLARVAQFSWQRTASTALAASEAACGASTP